MTIDSSAREWLLDFDPALRWQVERDVVGEPESVWQATRARVPLEGWGARLLSHQDDDGQWEGGAYFPSGFFDSAEAETPGQPWTATSWSLKDLREWGVNADRMGDTAERIAANCRWEYDDLPFWGGEVDVCINSSTIAAGAWLGADVSRLVAWFPAHQLEDGGWNCQAEEGDSVRSSFHSTLNALRGMLAYEQFTGDRTLRDSRRRGEEYLLKRRLMYRQSTGDPVGDSATEFFYPNRWVYSALAALDYFREAALIDGARPDERLTDAVDVVRRKRQPNGRLLQDRVLEGRRWFDYDVAVGEPSKWLTLIGTRVLDWWDTERAAGSAAGE